jgi:hypothetical protein
MLVFDDGGARDTMGHARNDEIGSSPLLLRRGDD